MDQKIIFAIIADTLAVVSYIPYFWNIYKGQTKPHAFSWFVWGLLTGIGSAAQFAAGGGLGAYVLAIGCVLNLTTAAIGFYQRHFQYSIFDWVALTGSILAILFWWITSIPLIAVLLICLSDLIAFLPTYYKGYFFPNEDTASTFAISVVCLLFSIIALESLNLTTWLYPALIAFLDAGFVALLLIRRRQLSKA